MTCKQCPLVADYKFQSNCVIKTCKYYTPATKNHCMMMDVTFSSDDSVVSDAELLHYKYNDKEITVKDVTRIRRRVVERVQIWFMFHRLIVAIKETFNPEEGFEYEIGRSNLLDKVLSSKPFNLPLFEFEPWMLTHLMDEEYCRNIVPLFSFRSLLDLQQRDYETLCKNIEIMKSGNTLFKTLV